MGEIRVPELGESILEATVGSWLKNVGDVVRAGETLVELETEKVNLEVIAEEDGVLQSITKQSGENVQVGEVIAVVGQAGVAGVSSAPATAATSAQADASNLPPRATPGGRRAALEHGVDLNQVPADKGRINRDDVVAHAGRQSSATATVTTSTPAAPAPVAQTSAPTPQTTTTTVAGNRPEERVRMTRRRLTIARRLVEVQHTAAMLTTFNEVDMTAIMDVRKRRKDKFRETHGVGLGFMSFFTKAVVGALKTQPLLNAEIQGEEMVVKKYYDIGVAVGTDAGLVVPVVRDADRLSFGQIEQQISSLATRARSNQLTIQELSGGTFTITNGGVFGSLLSTPILNAPQVGILGMHKIQERPIAINGEVVIRPMMYIALSYDHRIVDGGEAVRFLVKVKELLEDPEQLLLEG